MKSCWLKNTKLNIMFKFSKVTSHFQAFSICFNVMNMYIPARNIANNLMTTV